MYILLVWFCAMIIYHVRAPSRAMGRLLLVVCLVGRTFPLLACRLLILNLFLFGLFSIFWCEVGKVCSLKHIKTLVVRPSWHWRDMPSTGSGFRPDRQTVKRYSSLPSSSHIVSRVSLCPGSAKFTASATLGPLLKPQCITPGLTMTRSPGRWIMRNTWIPRDSRNSGLQIIILWRRNPSHSTVSS